MNNGEKNVNVRTLSEPLPTHNQSNEESHDKGYPNTMPPAGLSSLGEPLEDSLKRIEAIKAFSKPLLVRNRSIGKSHINKLAVDASDVGPRKTILLLDQTHSCEQCPLRLRPMLIELKACQNSHMLIYNPSSNPTAYSARTFQPSNPPAGQPAAATKKSAGQSTP